MLDTGLVDVERHQEIKDSPPVLHRDHPPHDERAPVADAVDLEEDKHPRVAGAEEVRVQRVHAPPLHSAPRRHQRLPGDLPAEHLLPLLVQTTAAEDVLLDLLQVEEAEQVVEGCGHAGRRLPRRAASPPAAVRRGPCGPPRTAGVIYDPNFMFLAASDSKKLLFGLRNPWTVGSTTEMLVLRDTGPRLGV